MRYKVSNYIKLEEELRKRCIYPYNWGRKQSNDWDFRTNFIYSTYSFNLLVEKCKGFPIELRNYAYNRWYNYWSAVGIESIFIDHPIVSPENNERHKTIDFYINEIAFDHKTSVYPKGFNKPYSEAINNKEQLIIWLYENQSKEGRFHRENRLFIVLYDNNREHWKLKSEILNIKYIINNYLDSFSKDNLIKLELENGKIVYSDVIWINNTFKKESTNDPKI